MTLITITRKEQHISADWVDDIFIMQDYYVFHDKIEALSNQDLRTFLKFRFDFLQEELNEAKEATSAEDVVDAMIDLCVVAIGTLDGFGVDSYMAWDRVLEANMAKTPGIKPERPNPLGLPDLIKPEGWVAPSHKDNHGFMNRAFEDDKPAYGPCEI